MAHPTAAAHMTAVATRATAKFVLAILLVAMAGILGGAWRGAALPERPTAYLELAVFLGSIGTALLIHGAWTRHAGRAESSTLGAAFLVLLAVVLFALLAERAGLLVALAVLVGVTRLAEAWRGAACAVAGVATAVALVQLVFVQLLGVRVAIWPAL